MDAAQKETQIFPVGETGKIIDFTAKRDEKLTAGVTASIQEVYPHIRKEDVISHAEHPVPEHPVLNNAGALRVGAEPRDEEFSPQNVVRLVTEDLGEKGPEHRILGGKGKHGVFVNFKRWTQQRLAGKRKAA